MNPKPWYLSKTLWFNIVIAAVSLLAEWLTGAKTMEQFREGIIIVGLALANMVLRIFTKQPIE